MAKTNYNDYTDCCGRFVIATNPDVQTALVFNPEDPNFPYVVIHGYNVRETPQMGMSRRFDDLKDARADLDVHMTVPDPDPDKGYDYLPGFGEVE